MKKLLASAFMCLTLAGCSGTTVGDGVFDAREQAYFKAGVGTVISAKPETAAPVYAVATTCLGLVSLDLEDAFDVGGERHFTGFTGTGFGRLVVAVHMD